MENKIESIFEFVKSFIYMIIGVVVLYLCVDFLFNKEVSDPGEWEKYKNCQDTVCCRNCYRGLFEQGLEYFDKADVPRGFKYELRDLNEHFSMVKIDEFILLKIKNEEQLRIEKKIGDNVRVDLFWEKVFGLSYQ